MWKAMVTAAEGAGFKPLNGTIAQATVINARTFSWDGNTLAFTLTVDDATPPTPPSP